MHTLKIFAGGGGLVVKICFDDGICWADKTFAGFQKIQNAYYGKAATDFLRKYCPNIPVPESRGWFKNRVHHEMTEWIEGKTLQDKVLAVDSPYYSSGTRFGIPPKLPSSLAEFVYNVTSCPIPEDKSNVPLDRLTDDVQCANWKSFLFLGIL